MSTELDRIAELARGQKEVPVTSIAHRLTVVALDRAVHGLRKEASAGVDGVTNAEDSAHARENLPPLHERLKSGQYRAQPWRRVDIPKEAGTPRAISIPALEDTIVQRAVLEQLTAIDEQDFLACSYGFRPGRSAQEALDEIGRGSGDGRSGMCGKRTLRLRRRHREESAHGVEREAGAGREHSPADQEMNHRRGA